MAPNNVINSARTATTFDSAEPELDEYTFTIGEAGDGKVIGCKGSGCTLAVGLEDVCGGGMMQ